MDLAVKTAGLTKIYNGADGKEVRALDTLNLEVPVNQIFGFLGPNGAGKTTTIKLLLGLIAPTSGRAWILGKDISDTSGRKDVGFLPESPYFYDDLSAFEFLDFFGGIFNIPGRERVKKIELLLDLVGLTKNRKQRLRQFSRGMLQRIGIAQALINDPQLLFLDEPITGLDPVGQKEIRDIILRVREEGKTIFFSSHDLSDVELICDHIGILCEGKLIKTGSLNELLATTETEISAEGLSGEIFAKLEGKVKDFRKEGGRTMFNVTNEALADEVVHIIEESGGKHLSVVPKQESLEEFFLKSIGRKELGVVTE